MIITFIALFISFIYNNDGNEYLSDNGYCWLHEKTFIFFFIIPVAVVIAINCYIFVRAIIAANRVRKRRGDSGNAEKIYGQIKTWAFLSFLLGQTWASGFLIQKNMEGFSYVFVILNGSTGIFLFIHSILMSEIVMLELKIRFGLVDQVSFIMNKMFTFQYFYMCNAHCALYFHRRPHHPIKKARKKFTTS